MKYKKANEDEDEKRCEELALELKLLLGQRKTMGGRKKVRSTKSRRLLEYTYITPSLSYHSRPNSLMCIVETMTPMLQ